MTNLCSALCRDNNPIRLTDTRPIQARPKIECVIFYMNSFATIFRYTACIRSINICSVREK